MKKCLLSGLFLILGVTLTLSIKDPDFRVGMGFQSTSKSLTNDAKNKCKNVPELDGQYMFCVIRYIQQKCNTGLDLEVCAEVER